ncbi:MAG: protoporphyrinogen oxidase, partial [Chloroflexota bacterium]|nr:protoporphyrinogen oxidase [Chloroflexota bacterium]
ITGLAAARDLVRAGVDVVLVEAGDRLGGKIATNKVGGFVVELGPDSMLTTRPAAVTLARELGLGDELIGVSEPRSVHILRDRKPVPMPEGVGLVLPSRALPFVTTRLFSWPEKLRMGVDLVMPRQLGAEDTSVGGFLRRRLGSALVSRLAGPLVGGIYGTSIDELSLDAVVPTLRDAERDHRSLIVAGLSDGRRIRARIKAAPPAQGRPLGVFASLRGGLGHLVAALESELSPARVERGVSVERLSRAGTTYRAHLSDGRELRVDGVIVTSPGPATARLLADVAPRASAAVAAIAHGSTTVVNLAYRLEQFASPPVGHGWLIPANEGLPLSALTWSSNKWAGRAPADSMLIRAFLPDQPSGGRTVDDLVTLARSSVERLAGVRGEPALVRAAAYAGTMPRYTVGHLTRVATAESEVAGQPTLALAGALYHGVGLPDCISSGISAARKLIDALGETGDFAADLHSVAVPTPVLGSAT